MVPPYAIPVVALVLSVPLMMKVVPPNRFYGFRTPQTLGSELVWYEANRFGGIYIGVASALGAAVAARMTQQGMSFIGALGPYLLLLSLAILASLARLRKLGSQSNP